MAELQDFVKLSKYAGERFDLVQAGGGNTSCHLNDGMMLIKASGFILSEVGLRKGYTKVNNSKVLEVLSNKEIVSTGDKKERNNLASKLLEEAVVNGGSRPSIETFLHSLLYKYTLHTHPIVVSCLVSCRDWQDIIKKLFPLALLVDYKTPGVELALELKKNIFAYEENYQRKPEVIFLQNHGLIISLDDVERVISLNEEVCSKIERHLNSDVNKYKLTNKISSLVNSKNNSCQIAYLCEDDTLLQLLKTKREIFFVKPFCPDTLVYCGVLALEIKDLSDQRSVETYQKQYGNLPKVVIYKDYIFFLTDNTKKAREIEAIFKAHIMVLSSNSRLCDLLPDKELAYLNDWEAEQYRQKL